MLLEITTMAPDDYVGFTFFIGYMAMAAAAVFFFVERGSVDAKWKMSLLVSGLITGIAAVHYFYMRDYYLATGDNPTFFRYVDWTLTVPLMCVEFYLILKPSGATKGMLWKLILLSTVMLVTGYFGEAGIMGLDAQLWGLVSGIAYFAIVHEVFMGNAAKLAKSAGGNVESAHKMLCKFVLIGWAIYPIGYMAGTDGWYSGIFSGLAGQMDVIYNVGDAINKIGFGLVVYNLAVSK